jgi:hypothetical protein
MVVIYYGFLSDQFITTQVAAAILLIPHQREHFYRIRPMRPACTVLRFHGTPPLAVLLQVTAVTPRFPATLNYCLPVFLSVALVTSRCAATLGYRLPVRLPVPAIALTLFGFELGS